MGVARHSTHARVSASGAVRLLLASCGVVGVTLCPKSRTLYSCSWCQQRARQGKATAAVSCTFFLPRPRSTIFRMSSVA